LGCLPDRCKEILLRLDVLIYAFGNTCRRASAVSSLKDPPRVFTTMLRPSPSGNSGADVQVRVVGGKGGRTGHHRLVTRAAPAPIAEPKSTSEGQCAPVCTRE
jgi:hypothetical protein